MAIPQQLVQMLPGPAADTVQQLCDMAPGVQWNNQTLDDMLEGKLPSLKIEFDPPNAGITKIEADLFRVSQKVKKEWKKEIRAVVHYYCGRNAPNPYLLEHPERLSKDFPNDRKGLKDAISYLQETVQNVRRRGLCETCLVLQPPVKRLRVGTTGLCSTCVVQKAVFE